MGLTIIDICGQVRHVGREAGTFNKYVPNALDGPTLKAEEKNLYQVADDDKSNQNPQELRYSLFRFVNDPHDKKAHGDFGKTKVDGDQDLRYQTPLGDVGNSLEGQADKVPSHASLDALHICGERSNAKHLVPR